MRIRSTALALIGLFATVGSLPVHARETGEARIAVAANFTEPVKEIGALFEKVSGKKLVLSFGATGQFYAQISQGAPFDVLLSAHPTTPAKAVDGGFAVKGSAFTYAIGKLVLYSKSLDVMDGEAALRTAAFQKIAVANPDLAPYGAAGIQVMQTLGVYDALKPKIVQGNTIAQTFQFVDTGNAEVGFVALSQVVFLKAGSRWTVPTSLYAPIRQDAVLLRDGADNDTAKAFLVYLKGPEAGAVIEKYGYGLPQ